MLSSEQLIDLSNLLEQGFICTDKDSNQFIKKISNTYFKILEQGFICTDEDSNQFIKKISNTYFKVLE